MKARLLKYWPIPVLLVFIYWTFFPVRETEFVLVTQFGRPVRTIIEAGLHAKWPFQSAIFFDRRLRIYNPRPSEFLTRDKKNVVVENYVLWKIQDPDRFVQRVGDPAAAEMRLHDIVWSGFSAALGGQSCRVGCSPAAELLDLSVQRVRRRSGTFARCVCCSQIGLQLLDPCEELARPRFRVDAGRRLGFPFDVPVCRGRRRFGLGGSDGRRCHGGCCLVA